MEIAVWIYSVLKSVVSTSGEFGKKIKNIVFNCKYCNFCESNKFCV